jgi:tetratricopeptide (TPR) repeat protein
LLAAAVFAAFAPVLSAGFVIFDDERYVLRNPHVQQGFTRDAVLWAWTAGHASNWHPLTWMSHMLDWQLYGSAPAGHHFTSLLLHALNAVLLFLLLDRLTGKAGRSFFAAALFALHPLHVESVAWVAERKDVLSTLLWILTAWAYVSWTRERGGARRMLVAGLLALGLTAKPMLVTLPLTLLVLDFWPLSRWPESSDGRAGWRVAWPLVREKLPLLLLAVASGAVTLAVQSAGRAVGSVQEFPPAARLANALVSCVAYLAKTVWPVRLAVFYPHPGTSLPLWKPVAAAAVVAAVTWIAVRLRRSHPYVLAGWAWYLITLLPVLGLVQVGEQAMADRYTYVPLIGPFVAAAWGVADAVRAARAPRVALSLGAVSVLLVLSLVTRAQASTWKDSLSLFSHAIEVTRDNYLAHVDLGTALSRAGRSDEALAHFDQAVRIRPDDAPAHYNLGVEFARRGRETEAGEQYVRALALDPGYAAAHNNLGILLAGQGKIADAARHYAEAARLDPEFAEAHYNLAVVLDAEGRYDEAWEEVEKAKRLGLEPREEFVKRLTGKRSGRPASR